MASNDAQKGAAVCTELTSGHDDQYEDIDNYHVNTGQGQSQATIESNTNITNTVLANGHDLQYEDMSQYGLKGQGQFQAITETNTITTGSLTGGHGHQKKESMGQHDQTVQEQSRDITGSLDANNTSYDMGPTLSKSHPLYENQQDQTGQGLSQAINESLEAGNMSYGRGQSASQPHSLYENQHDQTGQGPSQWPLSWPVKPGHGGGDPRSACSSVVSLTPPLVFPSVLAEETPHVFPPGS
ncbi:hypothetical protein Bbelb_216650 [Branchiostoma belcheri]|nr:hypothetical protein Bbelb_216650 [Branchiostoma belcheri]